MFNKPDMNEALFSLGNSLTEQGKLDEAILSYQNAIIFKPDMWEALFCLGNAFFKLNEFDNAITTYQKLLSIKPDMWETYYYMGEALLKQNKFDEAIQSYHNALVINSNVPNAYRQIGIAFQNQGQKEKAMASFQKALSMNYKLGTHYLAASFYESIKLEKAICCFKDALKLNHDIAEIHFSLGNAFFKQGKQKNALDSYQKAIAIKSDFYEPLKKIADVYFAQGKFEDSIACCVQITASNPNCADAYITMGKSFMSLGKEIQANQSYLKALEILDIQARHEKSNYDLLYKISDLKIKTGINKIKFIDKVAFIVLDMAAIAQYSKIWRHLDKKDYDIVVCPKLSTSDTIEELFKQVNAYLSDRNIPYISLSDCITACKSYTYMVSWGGDSQVFPSLNIDYSIAIRHIRYVLHGAAIWEGEWNDRYWMFLCQGPYQYDKISEYYSNKSHLVITGYPRFDDYFTKNYDIEAIKNEFSCLPERKTILWLPDHNYFSSINYYHDAILELSNDYNIVLKPHQNSFYEEPTATIIQTLKKSGTIAICPPLEDDNILFCIADYIFSDYGGSALTGIYLDINILLLNTRVHKAYSQEGTLSLEKKIRQHIINISPDRSQDIPVLLNDTTVWEKQKKIRQSLQKQFFAPYFGFSGKITADILKNLKLISST